MTERSLTLELESALESLSKAVFSQPIDKTADAKISVRPLLLRGGADVPGGDSPRRPGLP